MEQRFHQLHVQIELILHELQSIKRGIEDKKRKKTKQKVLPLYSHTLNRQGGLFGGALGRSVKLTCATQQLRSTTLNKRQQRRLEKSYSTRLGSSKRRKGRRSVWRDRKPRRGVRRRRLKNAQQPMLGTQRENVKKKLATVNKVSNRLVRASVRRHVHCTH